MSTIKSKILSLFSIFKNNGHFFVIFEVLICLCINSWYFLFVLIFYIIWLFIKNKRLMFFTLVLGIIFLSIFLVKELIYNNTSDLVIEGEVLNIQEKEYYNMLLIKTNNVKYLVKTKDQYRVGDILLVKGVSDEYKVHYPNQFDYNKYLHFQNIKSVISSTEIKKCGYKFNLRIFHDIIKNYINKTFPEKVSSYINTLTIGSSDTLDSTNIDKIGISHLFVISGLHVSILILIIEKILGLFKTNKKIMIIIEIMLIGFYVILTNFLISVIRVFVSLVLKRMTRIKGLDQISLNFIIVTLINPFYAFTISFILSYIIAFFMALYSNFIKIDFKNKLLSKILNYIINTLILTFLVQLLVLPIVISINPDFNLVSVLVNPIYIIFVTYLYLPISFIILIFPGILPIYQFLTNIFEYLTQNLANIEFLSLSLGNIHIVFKMLYYVVFYLAFYAIETKKYKLIIFLILFMFFWYYKGFFILNDYVYFLDLPVGDATLIISKNMHQVIVIDSGEVTKDNIFTKILKDFGIRKVDYLIISHSDSDHIGGAINMVKYIKVKNLILNYYDKNNTTNKLKQFVDNTYYLKEQDKIKTNYFNLLVISPKFDYGNTNDNSLAFILEIDKTKFLFTGDISTKVESDIISKYKIDVDYLKVAHHGSKTSTSVKFLNNIKYQYAVVMSGYYNTFGFPVNEVMERIPKTKQLRTDILQTIILKKEKNKFKIKK